ncbi:MAG: hypothetical protein ACYSUV_01990 [Planctomycetota bacterium]|jgi:hypothetical protein
MIAETVVSTLLEEEPSVKDIARSAITVPRLSFRRSRIMDGMIDVFVGSTLVGSIMYRGAGYTPYTLDIDGHKVGSGWYTSFSTVEKAAEFLWTKWIEYKR